MDRCLGKRVTDALRAAGMTVKDFHERYEKNEDDTPDAAWMAECAEHRWFVITQDGAIPKIPEERATLEAFAIGFFSVGAASKPPAVAIERILQARARIERIAQEEPRPFLFHIYPNGKVERKMSKARVGRPGGRSA